MSLESPRRNSNNEQNPDDETEPEQQTRRAFIGGLGAGTLQGMLLGNAAAGIGANMAIKDGMEAINSRVLSPGAIQALQKAGATDQDIKTFERLMLGAMIDILEKKKNGERGGPATPASKA